MRPTILHVGGVLYWTIQTRNPDTMVLKDADSTPSVAVRKNGSSVADSVTITKRSATTGLYDCSYNPASEVEGDSFQFEESAAVTGTTTSSATYVNQFSVQVRALERGTDGALQPTIASRTLNVSVDGEGDAVLNSGALRAALGMAAADLDDQLDAILAAGGAGTGARTVTITVNDGTTALQNATVRMTEGVNSYTALTDADGVAVFNLDDATYTVSITKSGYSYTGTTLVVNGTETATYSMTAISVTPPTSPSKSAIEVLCVDENVDAESGVAVDFRIVTIPTGDQNIAYKGTKQTATSDVDGIARFEVARGSVCEYKRGEADVWQRVTVDNDSVTNVTSFIGSP